jgi:hypothetical protein
MENENILKLFVSQRFPTDLGQNLVHFTAVILGVLHILMYILYKSWSRKGFLNSEN